MSEFGWIARYFAPLAVGCDGARGLKDDAASITIPPGMELVVTMDSIGEGVHFIGTESPDLIARKLLRQNLSDLAANGAVPMVYFLALSLPATTDEAWMAAFAEGLRQDQTTFGIHLAGGDTTRTQGRLTLSLTALGLVPQGTMLPRSGAKIRDDIYVSGTLGDAALGLLVQDNNFLRLRYQLPEPRLALGQSLRGIAHACMDISDGLMQDLGHLCATSGCGAEISLPLLPTSPEAQKLLARHPDWSDRVYGGGDDYELLFTAPSSQAQAIQGLATSLALPITRIGQITSDGPVSLCDATGQPLPVSRMGYQHF